MNSKVLILSILPTLFFPVSNQGARFIRSGLKSDMFDWVPIIMHPVLVNLPLLFVLAKVSTGNIHFFQWKYDANYMGLKGKHASSYVVEDGYMYLTAYFRDPVNICKNTRPGDGAVIGDRLTFKTGKFSYYQVPLKEEQIKGNKYHRLLSVNSYRKLIRWMLRTIRWVQ